MGSEEGKSKIYQWDYDRKLKGASRSLVCSVGIFQWMPAKRGKGLKKGREYLKVSGSSGDPESIFNAARAIVREFNENGFLDPRRRRVPNLLKGLPMTISFY